MSGFRLFREKDSDHWCVLNRNIETICMISKAYFIVSTMGLKKTYKVWLCESLGNIKGVGQQAKAKMNDLFIQIIADLQLRVRHNVIPKVFIWGFGQIYDIALQALPGKPHLYFKDHRKAKNPYLSRYGEIWVDKLNSSTAMSKLCCITDLICFMVNEA